jgi:hypothetical protein
LNLRESLALVELRVGAYVGPDFDDGVIRFGRVGSAMFFPGFEAGAVSLQSRTDFSHDREH